MASILRLERRLDPPPRSQIRQRINEYARAALQVVDRDLLIDVVAGIRFAGEPHAERDRAREALGVCAAAGDGRLGERTRRLFVIGEQSADQLRVRVEDELRVLEVAAGNERRAARGGELRDERVE